MNMTTIHSTHETPPIVGALTADTLIACLGERAEALRSAGDAPIPIGGLPELIERAIALLQAAR